MGNVSILVIARSPCDEAIQAIYAEGFWSFAALAMTEFAAIPTRKRKSPA